jgi:hypothetical protein
MTTALLLDVAKYTGLVANLYFALINCENTYGSEVNILGTRMDVKVCFIPQYVKVKYV